ncbi:RHS repeat-associated core domain-containing protein [Stenotrophomonas sp. 278]|uniref:RHS repeat-associated core domain-containing protein n=1 Tax=Stenotrophomonas sp. 278 TaxID=2479851 RepID=UPI0021ADD402|nr:RHS repeat-associated core domain-containing protein [Stenotrophomonas sp. 278]
MAARYLTAILVFLCALVVHSPAIAQQSPIPPEYCFDGRCYRTLAQAEADLRASTGIYGSRWHLDAVNQTGSGPLGVVLQYVYWIDDEPPAVTGPLEYAIGGGEAYPSEEGGIAAYLAKANANSECEFKRVGMVGEHGEPYVHILWGGRRGTVLNHSMVGNDPQPNKYVEISTWCPAWSPPSPPRIDKVWVPKRYSVECAEGFLIKDGSNPKYVPGSTDLGWPNICRPATVPREISGRYIKQTNSCAVNGNPCHPATGDKSRAEPDFIFAGREFVRYYHSLNELQAARELGVGWTHSYADYILRGSSNRSRVDQKGYLQTYWDGRGTQSSGETLRDGANGTQVLTGSGGVQRTYGANGRLEGVDTGDAATSIAVTYDQNLRIGTITDGLGRSLVFSYAEKRLASITLPDGSQARYAYDGKGNLTEVTRPDGTIRKYIYAEVAHAPASVPNLLTGIEEAGQRYATFSYDANGMVTGSKLHAEGQAVDVTAITYNAAGAATSINSLGDVKQHTIGGGQFSAITSTTDSQGTRAYNYDSSGRLTSRVDARGNRVMTTYVDSSSGSVSQIVTRTEESIGRITRTTRDANNRVVEERVTQKVAGVEQLASLQRTVPDAQGRPLYTCQYDATQPTDYACGSLALAPSNVRQTQHLYCTEADVASNPGLCPIVGLHRSTRDPAGNLTRLEYYAANDPGCDAGTSCTHRKGDLRAQINALGQRTEILEYDAAGNAIRIQAIDGTETERLYDSMGRMVTETLKGDVPANDRISLFEYSSTGKMTKSTGPDGVWTRMHYDTADRLTSVEDALGNRIVYTLDGAGNRVKEEIRDTAGTLRKVLNRSFDTASRNTRIAGADGYATLLRYDGNGNVLESENAHGTITRQTYDGADRVLTEVQDLGGINAQVGYEYASNGQVAAVTDPKGLRTAYGYNGFGDQISLVSPDTGTTTFTVDINGNRKTKTDARGITATYHYDALNRLIGIGYPDPNLDVGYAYDTAPDVCAANERFAAGRVGYVRHEGGSTAYCYDRFGQLTRKVQTVNGVAMTVRYGYTPGGRLARLHYPDGSVADYQRDTLGRISEVGVTRPGQARQVVVTNVTYAPFGPATGWTYGNGRTLQRPVDQDYRTVAVNDPMPGGLSIRLGYDEVGDITELKNGDGTEVLAQYGYDALGRLTQTKDGVTGTPIETYEYDATGNRTTLITSAGTEAYTYPDNSQLLTAVGTASREYDAAGNTLSIGDREFVYGDSNRMFQVKRGSLVAETFGYNHRGERIGRQSSASGSEYALYDERGQWLGNYGSSGAPLQQAIWLDSLPVAVVSEQQIGGSQLAFLQPDHMGTPRMVIDAIRDVTIWEWDSKTEVFGNQIPNSDADGDGVSYELAMRFPGQLATDASALFYNYQREYDPSAGRYSQSDPIGLNGGLDTYSYVGGNPLIFSDPYGLERREECIAAATLVGAMCGSAGGAYLGGTWGAAGGGLACSASGPGALACAGAGGMSGAAAGGYAGGILGQKAGQLAGEAFCPGEDEGCPPCKTVDGRTVFPGTIGYRHDRVPPSKPHHPYAGDHYNLYRANQNPNNCQCFWQNIGAADAAGGMPPPPGSVPISDFVR